MKYIDNFLNQITMYRLVLYYLTVLFLIAIGFSFFGILAFNPFLLFIGALFIIFIAVLTNNLFASFFKAPVNVESVYITAFILVFLITPMRSITDITFIMFAFWGTVLAMASKFILAIRNKHIFNPAAIAIVLTAFALHLSASWWIGTAVMAPFVLLGGLLVVRKLQRSGLVWAFFIVALGTFAAYHIGNFQAQTLFRQIFLDSPIFFFAFVMLTEPLTMPATRSLQIVYGGLVGFLFLPFVHIGNLSMTPELALVIGNLFSYAVSPKVKAMLTLKEKRQLTSNVYDFVFATDRKFSFRPGQYIEWTLPHTPSDDRGNRRYFTIASSPTEQDIIFGIKFYEPSSSFKKALLALKLGTVVSAGQLSGEFILPKNPKEKLVFIAGGIGVTPFRSMVQYLIDTGEKRDIVFLYGNRTKADIAYHDFFAAAEKNGVKTMHILSEDETVDVASHVYHGKITSQLLHDFIPDFHERHFYISGTHAMVTDVTAAVHGLGIEKRKITTDFFPGF